VDDAVSGEYMYDTIVVGARCAGSSLAMLLARRGARVLLVDRATFPADILHGHFIHRHGPRRLRDWGLLSKVAARTPAVTSMIFDAGDFPLLVRDLVEDGVAWGYGPRRTTLDKILVDAAVESGAELREGFTVSEYLFENDRLVGMGGRGPDGVDVEERATITVGADGRNSRLARAVHAPVYNDVPTILCYYFSYWSNVRAETFELYSRDQQKRIIFSFKTEGDLYAVHRRRGPRSGQRQCLIAAARRVRSCTNPYFHERKNGRKPARSRGRVAALVLRPRAS
jgi:flavin-dependent dehydrogenase